MLNYVMLAAAGVGVAAMAHSPACPTVQPHHHHVVHHARKAVHHDHVRVKTVVVERVVQTAPVTQVIQQVVQQTVIYNVTVQQPAQPVVQYQQGGYPSDEEILRLRGINPHRRHGW